MKTALTTPVPDKLTGFIKVIVIVFVIVTTTLVCCSCGSTKVASQLVEHTTVDTIYLSSQQYDSIYIYQDRLIDRSRDTLYIKDKSIEYRYKLLRDTIYKTRIDSIPYELTIIETKEIPRPLTLYDKTCRTTFCILIGFLLFWTCSKFKLIIH